MTVIEFNSGEDLGAVLGEIRQGKKTVIIREWGVEKFTAALDKSKCKLETVAVFPRKIINLRAAEYQIKKGDKNGNNIIKRGTKASIK
jgi:hypothetical protein